MTAILFSLAFSVHSCKRSENRIIKSVRNDKTQVHTFTTPTLAHYTLLWHTLHHSLATENEKNSTSTKKDFLWKETGW